MSDLTNETISADNITHVINVVKQNAEKLNVSAVCTWFSEIYYYNMLFLALSFIIFIVGLEKAPKKLTYTAIFWIVSVGISILTTLVFGLVCHRPLPRPAVLTYF